MCDVVTMRLAQVVSENTVPLSTADLHGALALSSVSRDFVQKQDCRLTGTNLA